METANIKTALDEQGLKNNQESSFIRLWKWLDRGSNHLWKRQILKQHLMSKD
jgi:hypothetical protein